MRKFLQIMASMALLTTLFSCQKNKMKLRYLTVYIDPSEVQAAIDLLEKKGIKCENNTANFNGGCNQTVNLELNCIDGVYRLLDKECKTVQELILVLDAYKLAIGGNGGSFFFIKVLPGNEKSAIKFLLKCRKFLPEISPVLFLFGDSKGNNVKLKKFFANEDFTSNLHEVSFENLKDSYIDSPEFIEPEAELPTELELPPLEESIPYE